MIVGPYQIAQNFYVLSIVQAYISLAGMLGFQKIFFRRDNWRQANAN
jgi:hypothetical protein